MDKQKQIEEIAKELCPHYDNGNCYYEVTEVCECCFGCEFCWAISQVLNAGFRKIPKNAVVLTGTEAEEHFVDLLTEFDEMGFHPETTVPYPMVYADEWKRRMLYAIGQLRKETAEKFAEKLKELEEALLDMVVQFCQMGEEGKLKHIFMSAEEQAFDVLDITYGENVSDVYERFNKKWDRPIDEICKGIIGE